MFANFSFAPSSPTHRPQSQYDYPPISHDASRTDTLSPTSSRSTSPSGAPSRSEYPHLRPSRSHIHLSVTELSQKLSAHTLKSNRNLHPRHCHYPQPRRYASCTPTPPPCEDDDETFFEEESSPPRATERGTRMEASCRRRQRQTHTRLQCDPQHLKALADLVEGMVKAGSQCFVYEAPGVASLTSSEEDGDADEASSSEDRSAESIRSGRRNVTSTRTLGHKQSLEWSTGRTCVLKIVKVRKDVSRRGAAQVRRPER